MQTNFESKVIDVYDRALKRGALHSIESTITHITENDIEFEIRFAPSLAKKPTATNEQKDVHSLKFIDPFAPYEQDLFVQEYGKHVILMNKFCVVPNHLLVVTREFEKQIDPLNQEDLTATWYCMMQIKGQQTIAFYNSGGHSGASQPHKHVQIFPIPQSDTRFSPPINAVVYTSFKKPGEIFDFPELPYLHYVVLLDPQKLSGSLGHSYQEEVGKYLTETYNSLVDAMTKGLHASPSASSSPLSSNFLLTHTWMMVVPRRSEKYERLSINSLGFAGMVLVKSEEELEYVKNVGVLRVLEGVGIPKNEGPMN